jgi:protein-S-isoprenylcysteine O-methyltransferase Ste14
MTVPMPEAAATRSPDRTALAGVQRRRKLMLRLAVMMCGLVFLVMQPRWHEGGFTHETLELLGLGLAIVCIAGRAWCILYIGGRKSQVLIDLGPYSVSRNPLYLFSFVGAFGVGLQSGSATIGIACFIVALAVFVPVVRREEEVLSRAFGPAFAAYRARVPRFGPRLSAWRDATTLSFAPTLLYHTVRDGLVFTCAYPVFEAIDWAQNSGHLPVLMRLP